MFREALGIEVERMTLFLRSLIGYSANDVNFTLADGMIALSNQPACARVTSFAPPHHTRTSFEICFIEKALK